MLSAGEIGEFVETVDAARAIVKKAYLYTNNHFSAKSVANAAMIKTQLGEPLGVSIPRRSERAIPTSQSRPHRAVAISSRTSRNKTAAQTDEAAQHGRGVKLEMPAAPQHRA
jgi:hypothetical protein